MLALDDANWSSLEHAYGPATDTPNLLRALAAGDASREVREALFSSLWHQGSVYTASYAAVPHIVDALPRIPLVDRLRLLVLATGIAAASYGSSSPPVPEDVKADLEAALGRARPIVVEMLFARLWEDFELRYLLGGIAIVSGRSSFGLALYDLDAAACRRCGADIDVMDQLGARKQ